jgi:hypothetical protein
MGISGCVVLSYDIILPPFVTMYMEEICSCSSEMLIITCKSTVVTTQKARIQILTTPFKV